MMNYATAAGGRGICPEGWHIPTDEEWITLQEFLGGNLVAGGLMKEEGTEHWMDPNAGGTNESGFTGLPGGFSEAGIFTGISTNGHFWTSSTFGFILSTGYELRNASNRLFTATHIRTRGFSVRCLQD
jgi:uncharacterized protein (TIGR02145 family)